MTAVKKPFLQRHEGVGEPGVDEQEGVAVEVGVVLVEEQANLLPRQKEN